MTASPISAIGLWSYWTTAWIRWGLASSRAVPCWPSARASSPARDTSTAPRLRHHTVPLSLPDRPTSSSPSAGEELGMVGCLLLLLVLALIILRCYWVGRNASSPSPPMYPWGSPGCCWPRYSSMWACACTSCLSWGSRSPFSAMAAPPSSPFTPPWASSPASGQDPPQLASGPEPALTLADPRSRR